MRRRSPWLLDLVTLNRSRDPGTSGRVYVCVVDLLDGVDHLTLGRGISVYVPSLRSPDARRLIAGAALGPGLLLVESVQPAAEGAAALLRARVDDPDRAQPACAGEPVHRGGGVAAGAGPCRGPAVCRSGPGGDPPVDRRGHRRLPQEGARGPAAGCRAPVRRGSLRPVGAGGGDAGACGDQVGGPPIGPGPPQVAPRPTLVDPMHPPLSWDELRAALEGELSVLPRDGVLTLREWRPSGVTARLSRRRDDGELELEVPDDRHLPSTRRGGAERAAALRALGWLDTDSVPGGWVCWRWPTPATARQLAAAALDTLHLVFAVERPERLGVRAVLGSASARLPMPDVPLLEYDPMTYVTQRGPRIEPERARNGRYVVTEDGDRQLVEHDEKEYLVVDDPSRVGVLPEMVFGGSAARPCAGRRTVCAGQHRRHHAEPSPRRRPSSWSAAASTC